MKILAVDDEQLMLDALTASIRKAVPDAEVFSFKKSSEALTFASANHLDVAFLDIQMRGMDGLELGKRLLKMYPEMNLIYCTSYDEHVSYAFREVRCNGYIFKPVDAQQVREEMNHLRKPIAPPKSEKQESKRIRVRCLGRFDIFVNDKVVDFRSAKAKELLAYLIHANGGICKNQEIISALWEDNANHDSYLKKIRNDLFNTLKEIECEDLIIQVRGGLAVNTRLYDSDYTEWNMMYGKKRPTEYMVQYSWSEKLNWE